MAFQSQVNTYPGSGVPGELYLDGPLRAQPVLLSTTDAANNVFGRALTIVAGGTATGANGDALNPKTIIAQAGGAGIFAGIMANPKENASYGTASAGPFGSTITMPNGSVVSAVQETAGIWVQLPAASNIGDNVFYLTATGALVTAAPSAAAPANSAGPIGKVERFTNAAASLAVISVLQPAKLPAA